VILSDVSIRKALADGRIIIEPIDDDAIQPSSVDLHVDRYFRVFRNDTTPFIDPKEPQENLTELVEVSDDAAFILHPGEFVLGSTYERVALPDDLVSPLPDGPDLVWEPAEVGEVWADESLEPVPLGQTEGHVTGRHRVRGERRGIHGEQDTAREPCRSPRRHDPI